jgi:hypothetical protein
MVEQCDADFRAAGGQLDAIRQFVDALHRSDVLPPVGEGQPTRRKGN